MPVTMDVNAALGQEGQIILTSEDGQAYPVTVSGMINIPMPHQNLYHISSLQAQQGSDGTLQVFLATFFRIRFVTAFYMLWHP